MFSGLLNFDYLFQCNKFDINNIPAVLCYQIDFIMHLITSFRKRMGKYQAVFGFTFNMFLEINI